MDVFIVIDKHTVSIANNVYFGVCGPIPLGRTYDTIIPPGQGNNNILGYYPARYNVLACFYPYAYGG